MKLDSIISEYLSGEGSRLIIPKFGAFIKRDGKNVAFTDLLTSDDGVLVNLVSNKLKVATSEAIKVVLNYSTLLTSEIENLKQTTIIGVGTITATDDGIVFNSEQSSTISSKPVTAKKEAATKDTTSAEAMPVKIQNDRSKEDTAKKIAEVKKDDSHKSVNKELTTKKTESSEKTTTKSHKKDTQESTKNQSDDLTTDKVALPVEKVIKEHNKSTTSDKFTNSDKPIKREDDFNEIVRNKPRRKTDWVMIIAIIALLIAISVVIYGRMVERGFSGELLI